MPLKSTVLMGTISFLIRRPFSSYSGKIRNIAIIAHVDHGNKIYLNFN
jgi:hypothetical protein